MSDILRSDHGDVECKLSERGQVRESRGRMCETSHRTEDVRDAEEFRKVVLARGSVEQMVSRTQLRQGNLSSEREMLLQVGAECVTEKLSVCICNEDRHTESSVKNVVMSVF